MTDTPKKKILFAVVRVKSFFGVQGQNKHKKV